MNTITKYQSIDGSEWTDPDKARGRDALCSKVDEVMQPLSIPEEAAREVASGKGWHQHDLEVVNTAKDALLEICREEGLNETYKVFNRRGRYCHPLSIIGRILDDMGGPLNRAWGRFGRIDENGREHQQPFFAYTNGPLPDHVCVGTFDDMLKS